MGKLEEMLPSEYASWEKIKINFKNIVCLKVDLHECNQFWREKTLLPIFGFTVSIRLSGGKKKRAYTSPPFAPALNPSTLALVHGSYKSSPPNNAIHCANKIAISLHCTLQCSFSFCGAFFYLRFPLTFCPPGKMTEIEQILPLEQLTS
ncbi:hypothetical protein POVCU2_0036320 [Plasmodium ovale curtisi]|uniref:Uncharacterized protein n=1 Tax=Plasmodium ovale curtisi TaxID=864141 RepID=A0A1A8W3P9_PLAOA|nr:hypothetical protein POVCU2_0036320 [Plasmodium ovale curtisi]SBS96659.1 hypothetical protein POVCU1_033300 [Plasmodium ovale curtisi]